jgi:hypothetical protein
LESSLKVMKCKAVLKEIEELERGAAPTASASAHLLSCASCKAFADERNALRQLVASLEPVSTPTDFDWRLRARIREAGNESDPATARRWPLGFAPGLQAITVAASVTLLLVAVVIYRQARPASATPSAVVAAIDIKESAKVEDTASPTVKREATVQDASGANIDESRTTETVRPRNPKNVKANATRADVATQSIQPQQRIFSTDFVSRGAEDLTTAAKLPGSSTDAGGPVISVRVPSPKSWQLRFEDGQGTRRTLSPVNFGGQELIERPDKARLVPASEKGIW